MKAIDYETPKELEDETPYWSIYRFGDKLWKSYYQFRYSQVWFENVIMPNVEVVNSSYEKIKIYLVDDIATNYWTIYYVRDYDKKQNDGPQVWKQYYKSAEEQKKAYDPTVDLHELYVIAHSENLEEYRKAKSTERHKGDYMSKLTDDFKYYLVNQEELLKKYKNKVLVIQNRKVVGEYDTEEEAIRDSIKKGLEIGTFLVQRCMIQEIPHFYNL